jgi:cysteine desulfurase/selenocysteine lyase
VLRALDDYYRRYNANIHRGVYKIAEEATEAYEAVRGKVARLLNARSDREIVFTRGTTESVNLVANSVGPANVAPATSSVLSEMEHHSNLVPWQLLAAERAPDPLDSRGRERAARPQRVWTRFSPGR